MLIRELRGWLLRRLLGPESIEAIEQAEAELLAEALYPEARDLEEVLDAIHGE